MKDQNFLPESKLLGKKVDNPKEYDPSILVAVPRELNRSIYDINDPDNLFTGCDIWHAWEFSLLTNKGLPVTGVLKIKYSSHSPDIVESKSLKLYLNSFNMEKFGDDPEAAVKIVLNIIQNDLSNLLKTEVEIRFFDKHTYSEADFSDYIQLEKSEAIQNIEFTEYTENKHLLISSNEEGVQKVYSDLLRSNCKITNQPDWGSVFIYLKGKSMVNQESLLQYIVSLRNENHFHEEICELLYKRLYDLLEPEEICITCIYTRRGGIDICPTRTNKTELLPENLTNISELSTKLLRQ